MLEDVADYLVCVSRKPNGDPLPDNNHPPLALIVHRATGKLDATGILLKFIEEHPFPNFPSDSNVTINKIGDSFRRTERALVTVIPYGQFYDFTM
ncbi:MAG: hypothetical protein WC494_02240 [Candidatus Pacearchaeota archaeon]